MCDACPDMPTDVWRTPGSQVVLDQSSSRNSMVNSQRRLLNLSKRAGLATAIEFQPASFLYLPTLVTVWMLVCCRIIGCAYCPPSALFASHSFSRQFASKMSLAPAPRPLPPTAKELYSVCTHTVRGVVKKTLFSQLNLVNVDPIYRYTTVTDPL